MNARFSVVSRSFNRGAGRYRQLAKAQSQMGRLLWSRRPSSASIILDLGSGPGHWTERLASNYPDALVTGLDLSPAMIKMASSAYPSLNFVQGNAEALPLAADTLDLVFSNLAIQWCPNLDLLLAGLHRVLRPKGRALMTSLLPGSLQEIQQACLQVEAPSRLIRFQQPGSYHKAALAAGFQQVHLEVRPQVFYYPSSKDLLQSVTSIGASGGSGRLSKNQYHGIHQALEQQRQTQGLPLTYQLLIMELVK